MSTLNRILVLADFSPKSDNAVRRAALLARRSGAELHLLHVVGERLPAGLSRWTGTRSAGDASIARARRTLDGLAARVSSEHHLHATDTVRAGEPVAEVRALADGMDLVVVAAKRSNPLRDFVLGTPTERLLRILQRPVLVVKLAAESHYERALVPMELDCQPQTLLRMLAGALPEAALHLCHPGPHDVLARNLALRTLAEQAATGTELVVVAKDGHSAMGEFLLGTLAQRLVADARCDVMVVPRAALRSEALRFATAQAMRGLQPAMAAAGRLAHGGRP